VGWFFGEFPQISLYIPSDAQSSIVYNFTMFINRSLADKVKFVEASIVAFGGKVKPSSRIWEAKRALFNPDGSVRGIISPTDQDFKIAIEAIRDMTLLSFIFDNLKGENAPPDATSRVKGLAVDAALPENSKQSTPGRDMQFEMFVAAGIVSGGLPTRAGEPGQGQKAPDWICQVSGAPYAIEVKRLKSIDSMQERIEHAAAQVLQSKLSGGIVADFTTAFDPENGIIPRAVTHAEITNAANHCLYAFMLKYESKLAKWVEGSGADFIAVVNNVVYCEIEEGWTLTTFTSFLNMNGASERRRKVFQEHYLAGMV